MSNARTVHSKTLRSAFIAACLALGVLATLATSSRGIASAHSAMSHSSHVSAPSTPKPTIVLVHGAWADGSGFSGVTSILQEEGYTVMVPPNPLRGLPSDAAYIASFLAT